VRTAGIRARRPSWLIARMTRCSAKMIAHRGADVQPVEHICDSYRLFECDHCGKEIRICRCCDHGEVYCPGEQCASLARELKNLQYRSDHQQTKSGRKAHAARQAQYRLRREMLQLVGTQVVTDHPSTPPSSSVKVSSIEDEEIEDGTAQTQPTESELSVTVQDTQTTGQLLNADAVRCDVCGRLCRPFIHRWSWW